MSERDDFLAWVNSQLKEAEIAVHNGDATPRRAIWSRDEPVTVLGAWKSAVGRAEVDELFGSLEQTFSDCTSYRYDIVAAEHRSVVIEQRADHAGHAMHTIFVDDLDTSLRRSLTEGLSQPSVRPTPMGCGR